MDRQRKNTVFFELCKNILSSSRWEEYWKRNHMKWRGSSWKKKCVKKVESSDCVILVFIPKGCPTILYINLTLWQYSLLLFYFFTFFKMHPSANSPPVRMHIYQKYYWHNLPLYKWYHNIKYRAPDFGQQAREITLQFCRS